MDAHELPAAVIPSSETTAPNALAFIEPSSLNDYEEDPVLMQAVVDDFLAGWKMDERGELVQYDKQHVAIFNGQVVGADKNSEELSDRLIREQNIPINRQVIIFVGYDCV